MTEIVASAISVVIATYSERRWDDLCRAVRGTVAEGPREVLVIVDHNPELAERARAAFADPVCVYESTNVRGLSGARNCGLAHASGEVIAYLDDDAVPEPGWLTAIGAAFTDSTVVGVGGALLPAWPEGEPAWFPVEFGWVVGCSYRGLPDHFAPVRNAIGANMAVRRDAAQAIGGFREGFGGIKDASLGSGRQSWRFLQHQACDEDTEFCVHVTQRHPGTRWMYCPEARVRHTVAQARTRLDYFLWRCYDEGLGKAVLVEVCGPDSALQSERAYVRRTLPSGLLRYLIAAARGDAGGLLRAGALLLGLGATATGYGAVRVARRCGILAAPESVAVGSSR